MGRADDNFPLWEWFPTSFSFSLFKLPLSSVYYAGVSIILINLFVNRFLTLIVCLRSLHAYFDPHKMAPLTIESAMSKLRTTSTTIERRGRLRPQESRRIEQAIRLFREGPPADSPRHARYLEFLQQVLNINGQPYFCFMCCRIGHLIHRSRKGKSPFDLPHKLNNEDKPLATSPAVAFSAPAAP